MSFLSNEKIFTALVCGLVGMSIGKFIYQSPNIKILCF